MEDQYRRLAGSLHHLQTRLETAETNQTEVRLSLASIQHTVSLLDTRLQVVLLLLNWVSCPTLSLSHCLPCHFKITPSHAVRQTFQNFNDQLLFFRILTSAFRAAEEKT